MATVTFSIDAAQAFDVLLDYGIEPGSAQDAADYSTPLAPAYRAIIPAGSLTANALIPIHGDTLAEGPEFFTVSITSARRARLPENRSAFVIIADDDRIPVEFRNPALIGDSAQRGSSVALHGNRLFSGAPGSGFVEAWNISTGTLTQWTPSFTGFYGSALAAMGDRLAAGAWWHGTTSANRFGLVRLMDLSGNLLHSPLPSPNNSNSYAGYSLAFAVDANDVMHLLVGAPGDNTNGSNTGSVTVFHAGTGAQVRKILSPSTTSGHRFGEAIAASGSTAIIGTQAETAYLVDWTTGNITHTLTAPENATLFGRSVAIEGNLAIVGASAEGSSGVDKGKIFGFTLPAGSLEFVLRATDFDAPTVSSLSWAFGRAIAMDPQSIFVGASRDTTKGSGVGSVYAFDRESRTLLEKVYPSNEFTFQSFGQSLAAANGRVAIGAPSRRTTASSNAAGSTYLLEWVPSASTFSGAFNLWAGGAQFTPDPAGGSATLPGTSLPAEMAFILGLPSNAEPSLVNARLPRLVGTQNARFFELDLNSAIVPGATLAIEETSDMQTWSPVAWRMPNGTWQGPRSVIRENLTSSLVRVRVPVPANRQAVFQRLRLSVAP